MIHIIGKKSPANQAFDQKQIQIIYILSDNGDIIVSNKETWSWSQHITQQKRKKKEKGQHKTQSAYWWCPHTCFLNITSWSSIVFFRTSLSDSVYICAEFRSKSACINMMSSPRLENEHIKADVASSGIAILHSF